jgi:hypothetical protein
MAEFWIGALTVIVVELVVLVLVLAFAVDRDGSEGL